MNVARKMIFTVIGFSACIRGKGSGRLCNLNQACLPCAIQHGCRR